MYGHYDNYTHLCVSIISAFGSLEDIIWVIIDIRYTMTLNFEDNHSYMYDF